jgi:hypothetical protein
VINLNSPALLSGLVQNEMFQSGVGLGQAADGHAASAHRRVTIARR